MPELGQDEKIDGRTKDRWNAVERDALFLNFKSELSAYDKFMYFGRDPKRTKLKSKQDVIRRDAGKLKRLIGSDDKKNDAFYGRPITAENRLLTAKELDTVGLILGHKYIEARIIRHRLFGGQLPEDGLSVIFKRTNSTYSEAHAGSGEIAVVSTVIQILHGGFLINYNERHIAFFLSIFP